MLRLRYARTATTDIRSTVSRSIVLDASAAIAMVRREESADRIRHLLVDRSRAGAKVIVPGVFWVEVVNVLARRHQYTGDAILEAIAVLDGLGLTTVDESRPSLLLTIEVVVTHELTAYDAVYLALAESSDADLLTLDNQLAAAAGPRAVNGADGSIREAPEPYRLEPWISWDELPDYLAAARRAVASRG